MNYSTVQYEKNLICVIQVHDEIEVKKSSYNLGWAGNRAYVCTSTRYGTYLPDGQVVKQVVTTVYILYANVDRTSDRGTGRPTLIASSPTAQIDYYPISIRYSNVLYDAFARIPCPFIFYIISSRPSKKI